MHKPYDHSNAICDVLHLLLLTLYILRYNCTSLISCTQYEEYANEIISVSQHRAHQIVGTLDGISVTTTSYALDQELTWPFVKLPHFEERGFQVLEQSGATYVALVPLVSETDRLEWETWSVEQAMPEVITPSISKYNSATKSIGERAETMVGPYYAPIWEVAPPRPHRNMDLFTFGQGRAQLLSGIFQLVEEGRGTVLSELSVPEEFDPDDDSTWPYVLMASPTFDDFHSHSKLVALYASFLPFHKVLCKFTHTLFFVTRSMHKLGNFHSQLC